jgi:hypothetical protein
MSNKVYIRLLKPLKFYLSLSSLAYSQYLSNKVFLHAQSIYEANAQVKALLTRYAGIIPDEIEHDCLLLLNHFNIWMHQYETLKKTLDPVPETEFVFNRIDQNGSFPGASVARILKFVENYTSNV